MAKKNTTPRKGYLQPLVKKPLPTNLDKLLEEALQSFSTEEELIRKILRLKEAGMSNIAIEEAMGHWAAETGAKVVRPFAWLTAQENALLQERADHLDMTLGEYIMYLVYEDVEGPSRLKPLGKRLRLRRLTPRTAVQ